MAIYWIFGAPETHLRAISLNLLKDLHRHFSVAWLCAGTSMRSPRLMKSLVVIYGLISKFTSSERPLINVVLLIWGTWDENLLGIKITHVMLQFGNAWIGLQEQMCVSSFLASKATALKCWSSNHKPIVIYPLGIPERRFKQAWLEDESCHDSIKLAWRTNNSGSPMAQVKGKIIFYQKQFSTISQRLLSTRRNCYRSLKRQL